MKWLLCAFATLFASVVAAQQQVVISVPQRTISVSGSAEILVPPDEVNLKLAVESRDPKLEEAVRQNETNTANVLKFLKQSEIEAKDVQTDFVEIHPVYTHHNGVQTAVPQYYQVRRNFGVRLRKVPQFDAVLAGVLKAGANHVMGIEFRTTELRKHRDAARQKAIGAAREKANALASELGVKVGKPQSINERAAGGWWGWGGHNNYSQMQNVAQVAGRGGDPTEQNLSVGMISVSAQVDVTFTLE